MHKLYIKLFVIIITIIGFSACREQGVRLDEIRTTQVRIDSTLDEVDSLEAFIEPYRKHVNEALNAPLCYAPKILSKTDGKRNSSMGNLMADIILRQADKVLNRRENIRVDMAVLNYGGIRTAISRGPVSERTAYEVMPFENGLVVVGMKGTAVAKMVEFLRKAEVPHPVSGMKIGLDAMGNLESLSIQGRPLEPDNLYYVATSDYLIGGGDRMTFFQEHEALFKTGYKIRNAMVDYFREVDTLRSRVDDRFVQVENP
ncbi:MAG: 5'-nucleotidase [Robiginitalea sp.]